MLFYLQSTIVVENLFDNCVKCIVCVWEDCIWSYSWRLHSIKGNLRLWKNRFRHNFRCNLPTRILYISFNYRRSKFRRIGPVVTLDQCILTLPEKPRDVKEVAMINHRLRCKKFTNAALVTFTREWENLKGLTRAGAVLLQMQSSPKRTVQVVSNKNTRHRNNDILA